MPTRDIFIEVAVVKKDQSDQELIAYAESRLPDDFKPDPDYPPMVDDDVKALLEKLPDLGTETYNAAVLFHGKVDENRIRELEQSKDFFVWDSPSVGFP